jgi:hypothetical protein
MLLITVPLGGTGTGILPAGTGGFLPFEGSVETPCRKESCTGNNRPDNNQLDDVHGNLAPLFSERRHSQHKDDIQDCHKKLPE